MSLLIQGHSFRTKYPAEGRPLFTAYVGVQQEGWIAAVWDLRHPDGPNAPPFYDCFVDNEDEGKARVEQAIQRQTSRDGLKRETLVWIENRPDLPPLFFAEYPKDGDSLYKIHVNLIAGTGNWTTGIFDCKKTGVEGSLSLVPTGFHKNSEDAKKQAEEDLSTLLQSQGLPKETLMWNRIKPNYAFLKL